MGLWSSIKEEGKTGMKKCTFRVRKVVETTESRSLPPLTGDFDNPHTIIDYLCDHLTEEQLEEASEHTEVPVLLADLPPETSWRKATGEVRYVTASESFYKVTGYSRIEGKVLSVTTEPGSFRFCLEDAGRVAIVRIEDLNPEVGSHLYDYTCPK